MAALNATVSADKAAVENATAQLDYATIKAPISGRTGALMVHEGNLARQRSDRARDDQPDHADVGVILRAGNASLRIEALPRWRRAHRQGDAANDDGPAAVGKIAFIDNAVDENSGTIRVKGTFPNTDRRLWPASSSTSS